MAKTVKISDLAAQLGISATTISNWINEFGDYFSERARLEKGRRRVLDENDVLILATISRLSHEGNTYAGIHEQLSNGYRVDSPNDVNYGVNRAVVPAEVVEQVVDSAKIVVELETTKRQLEKALADAEKWEQRYEDAARERKADADKYQEKIDALMREIADLKERIGAAEREVQLKRNRRWWGGNG